MIDIEIQRRGREIKMRVIFKMFIFHKSEDKIKQKYFFSFLGGPTRFNLVPTYFYQE